MGNNNVYNNEIIAEINIKEDDINKEIRIINSYEEYIRKNGGVGLLKYKNEKEIKKNIIEINNKRIKFPYIHKFNKTGKYIIKYSFLKKIVKINHMISECEHLTNIDLSNFNTQNVIYMNCMFYGCNFLTNIDLSNFNTQNVKSMKHMFYGRNSLSNIDLSNFNTKNIIDMNHCSLVVILYFSLFKSFLFH